MTVETKGDELIIKVSNVSIDEIQDFLDYIELKEITSTSKATQEDVDELAKESKRTWWEKNGATYFPHIKQ